MSEAKTRTLEVTFHGGEGVEVEDLPDLVQRALAPLVTSPVTVRDATGSLGAGAKLAATVRDDLDDRVQAHVRVEHVGHAVVLTGLGMLREEDPMVAMEAFDGEARILVWAPGVSGPDREPRVITLAKLPEPPSGEEES